MTTGQILPVPLSNPCFHAEPAVSYGEREILHGISFDVCAANPVILAVRVGKSTLLRTLVGLENPPPVRYGSKAGICENLRENGRDKKENRACPSKGSFVGSMTWVKTWLFSFEKHKR